MGPCAQGTSVAQGSMGRSGSSSESVGFCLSRGGNLVSLSLGNKVGGYLVAWPCHSPGLQAGFKTFSAASSPPPPWVANRSSLVPAPIELPCSLHTKNGNPQAILGAVPSQTVAMAPCSQLGCDHSVLAPTRLLDLPLSLVPSPAYDRATSGVPC